MSLNGVAEKRINGTVKGFEKRVGRRIDQLCAADILMTRQKARVIALAELANAPGSKSWERQAKKRAAIDTQAQLAGLVRGAKRKS